MSLDGQLLFETGELGPCRAVVTVQRQRWRSGALRFVLSESWTPIVVAPAPAEGPARIASTDVFEDGEKAVATARERADTWSRSSARSDELAPGGRLRELSRP